MFETNILMKFLKMKDHDVQQSEDVIIWNWISV